MSRAGAKGLMQVMPRTAAYIAKNKSLRLKNGILFEPEYNLSLGQKYIMYLMSHSHINNNLLYIAAAYNAGPGNLKKWQKRAQGIDDPFLFIETLPSRETRNYVKKVMANLWIYSSKLNLPMPSLDEIAIGKWPCYASIKNSVFAKK
jgi:soluble lytic murein transglycosylase-like protein